MAVHAGRAIGHAGLKSPPVDGLVVLQLRSLMAHAARGGHVEGIDPGLGVLGTLQIVDAMAVVARSTHRLSFRHPLPVNGIGILLITLRQFDDLVRQESFFPMAVAAEVG